MNLRNGREETDRDERSQCECDPTCYPTLSLLVLLPLVQQLLLRLGFCLRVRRRNMFPLVILDDRSYVLDALDRESLEERNEGHEFLGGRIALGSLPGREEDTVRRLELEVRGVGVEDDGAF